MKIKNYYLLLLISVTIACNNTPKETNTQVDTLAAPLTEKIASETNTKELLKTIMGTGEGLMRGVKFGDAINEVKKKETLELFEDEVSHIGYTLDTENLETVDILYEKDTQNKLEGIQLDIYMNSEISSEKLKTEMGSLFSVKYGKPAQVSDMIVWKLKPEGQVSIKAVKNKLDRGLEVRFTKQRI